MTDAASRKRIDKLLVERGFFPSRNKAQKALMAGEVLVDGQMLDKSGRRVSVNSRIEVKGDPCPYVGRGGLKLEKALNFFNVDVNGKRAVDIGASTGGFTDCLLKNGAEKVWAVDVGYGQLNWNLRNDSRVKVLERTNARYLSRDDFPLLFELSVIDVSFISLKKIIPAVLSITCKNGELIALIKPQFEAGPEKVGKKGVVKDKETHFSVLKEMVEFIKDESCSIKGLTYSPIRGASEGNIEFFIYFKKLSSENIKVQEDAYSERNLIQLLEQAYDKLK